MIDTKSNLILKILAKECANGGYKIIESADILQSLPRHLRMDLAGVRHILNYLERQDMISIKYEENDTYCLCVLPFGYQTLENNFPKYIKKHNREQKLSRQTIILSFVASLIGTLLGILICYFVIKLF